MKYDTADIWAKTTHVQCSMCQAMHDVAGDTITGEDDIDLYYELMECCDDPFLIGLIITSDPLFPPDDPDSDINADRYIEDLESYHYELTDELFNELEGDIDVE